MQAIAGQFADYNCCWCFPPPPSRPARTYIMPPLSPLPPPATHSSSTDPDAHSHMGLPVIVPCRPVATPSNTPLPTTTSTHPDGVCLSNDQPPPSLLPPHPRKQPIIQHTSPSLPDLNPTPKLQTLPLTQMGSACPMSSPLLALLSPAARSPLRGARGSGRRGRSRNTSSVWGSDLCRPNSRDMMPA